MCFGLKAVGTKIIFGNVIALLNVPANTAINWNRAKVSVRQSDGK